jgi:tetratricopeptide (TPR) repeat protein
MLNIKKTLRQAHSLFTDKQYDKALFLYSQILSFNPTNSEYQLYCIFCDIASENDEKGQSLFDYFTVAKEENLETAIKYAKDIISAYDGSHEKMMKILKEFSVETTQTLDAIKYEDFEKLIAQRGSFKIAFQDIMFSTKVALTSKDEVFKFINQLIENDFEKTAYQYLDGFNTYFKYDSQMIELYEKLGSKTIELNNKQ